MGVIMKNKVNYTGGGGSGGASALADLEDVELTTPTDGQALVYDNANSKWINGNVSGDTLVIQDASIYSEDEQQIGVWIDGKPLYQKTFIFSNISTLTGSQSYQTDLSNVEEAFIEGEIIEGVNRYAIPWAGNSGYALGFFFSTSTNYIWTKGTDTFSNATLKITVKYTKTTDAAGSGGYKAYGLSPIIYSEEEREVGVWIDGKPLYQKTIDGGLLYNDSNEHDIAHNVLNLDHVVDIRTILIGVSNNAEVPAPNYRTSSQTGITVTRSGDYLHYRNNWQTANAFKIWFTIQYTKTTDTAGSGVWTTTGEYAHHYSTTEHVIGTWIDGKTLYERTIFTNPTWNNNSASIPLTNEICKNIEGGVCDANGENLIPFGYGSINEYVRLYQAGNILSLYNSFTSSRAYVQITIRYTKSL